MWEVRKFTVAAGHYSVLFSGTLSEAMDFLKDLSSAERADCQLEYAGDGTEGV